MRFVHFGLPVIAIVATIVFPAHQSLRRQQLATNNAGALPQAKILANKFFGPAAKHAAMKQAATKSSTKPRLAALSLSIH